MTQLPPYPSQQQWAGDGAAFGAAPKTSGLAITSLVFGILGLFTCCTFVPSILGIVFGGASLPAISSGATRGRGLAISGIVTGAVGLLLGVVVVVTLSGAPPAYPIAGDELKPSDRAELETAEVLGSGDEVEFIYSAGVFSFAEAGVILTKTHLVIYAENSDVERIPYEQISAIEFEASETFMDDGAFTVQTDDDLHWFAVGTGGDIGEMSDTVFYHKLLKNVTDARETAGLAPPAESLSEDED